VNRTKGENYIIKRGKFMKKEDFSLERRRKGETEQRGRFRKQKRRRKCVVVGKERSC